MARESIILDVKLTTTAPAQDVQKMKHFMLVPASPYLTSRRSFRELKEHHFYSYSRHAMISFLEFIKIKNKWATLRLLLPEYMCHEVINSLRTVADRIDYYNQNEDFSFDTSEIERQTKLNRCNVLMVSHLYGRYCANIEQISTYCKNKDITIIEDSAHLPWFYVENFIQHSDVCIYTYRKLFAVPYGASSVVNKQLKSEFSRYMTERYKEVHSRYSSLTYIVWIFREYLRQLVSLSGIAWRRKYIDLGDDPLQSFNRAPKLIKSRIKTLNTDNVVEIRRRNYALLSAFFDEEITGWTAVKFDLKSDVPYQFIFFRHEKIEYQEIIDRFLHFGVSVVRGLKLVEETADRLGSRHPFNNQLCLPIHQDVSLEQIEYMINICRKILVSRK